MGRLMNAPSISLQDKVVVVTGGGAGIGRGIASALAKCGARVVIAEIDEKRGAETEAAIKKDGGEALFVATDARELEQAQAMAEQAMARYGRIDALVNNVGDFLGQVKTFVETTPEDWDALYRINFHHVMACCSAVVPHIQAGGRGGSVVNISTIEAHRGIPGAVVYSAFKAAITGFTRSLALELGRDGIRVNAIAPETTQTPQVDVENFIPAEKKKHLPHWLPLQRFGAPQDAGGAALFLISDLSSWITGTTLHLDGGSLAAAGWYRAEDDHWTNLPIITDYGIG